MNQIQNQPSRPSDRAPAPIVPRRPRSRQVMVTSVGLRIPDAIGFGVWEETGHKIAQVANCSAWCLGDWLVYGQHKYTERYRHVVAAVNLDYQTLRNYAWVARRFELERRRPQLSFQHHAEVAATASEEQDRWLDLAEAQRWSRNELRRRVRAQRAEQDTRVHPGAHGGVGLVTGTGFGGSNAKAALPHLEISADRIARWCDAARQADRRLEDWIVATLDDGASQVLE